MKDQIDFTSERLVIAADHPSLPGHFPGRPVVPGVLGLQMVNDVMQEQRPQWQLCGIPQAKFLSPLLPGEAFTIELRGQAPRIEFVCRTDDRLIARGVVEVQIEVQATA